MKEKGYADTTLREIASSDQLGERRSFRLFRRLSEDSEVEVRRNVAKVLAPSLEAFTTEQGESKI